MKFVAETEKEREILKYLLSVAGLDKKAALNARERWDHVAKPLHSLGILEEDIIKIAGITGTGEVSIEKRALVIMCADNGVVEEGVTQTGQEVTAIVAENMTKGKSCACIMARQAAMDVIPVDMGIASCIQSGGVHPLLERKIAGGTRNFHREPAMTREQAIKAIWTGMELARQLSLEGYGLLATGEMGIGNTTTSSAVSSLLLKTDPELMTGRGAGLSGSGLSKKLAVVREAVHRYEPSCRDAVDVLSCVGGFDLAGLTGLFLGAAVWRIPVLIDGFISGTAALAAADICPEAAEFMLASHVSAEPAGRLVLDALKLSPVIEAGLCLGEGTGAVTAVPLLDMALAVYREMSTFQDISVEEYRPLS